MRGDEKSAKKIDCRGLDREIEREREREREREKTKNKINFRVRVSDTSRNLQTYKTLLAS